jgi:hypothetical protein
MGGDIERLGKRARAVRDGERKDGRDKRPFEFERGVAAGGYLESISSRMSPLAMAAKT